MSTILWLLVIAAVANVFLRHNGDAQAAVDEAKDFSTDLWSQSVQPFFSQTIAWVRNHPWPLLIGAIAITLLYTQVIVPANQPPTIQYHFGMNDEDDACGDEMYFFLAPDGGKAPEGALLIEVPADNGRTIDVLAIGNPERCRWQNAITFDFTDYKAYLDQLENQQDQ